MASAKWGRLTARGKGQGRKEGVRKSGAKQVHVDITPCYPFHSAWYCSARAHPHIASALKSCSARAHPHIASALKSCLAPPLPAHLPPPFFAAQASFIIPPASFSLSPRPPPPSPLRSTTKQTPRQKTSSINRLTIPPSPPPPFPPTHHPQHRQAKRQGGRLFPLAAPRNPPRRSKGCRKLYRRWSGWLSPPPPPLPAPHTHPQH